MGGTEAEVQPLCRSIRYKSGSPPEVATGGLEVGGGGDNSSRKVSGSGGGGGRGDGDRGGDRGGVRVRDINNIDYRDSNDKDRATGAVSLAEGCGASTGGLPGG